MDKIPVIAFALALSLGLAWLFIRSMVKSGMFTEKAGRSIFAIVVGLCAVVTVLAVLFTTVFDFQRDILLLVGIVVALSVGVVCPLAVKLGKANRAEQAEIAEARKADPSLAPTPEEAAKQEMSRKRWTVVLYVFVGLFVLYHLLRIIF